MKPIIYKPNQPSNTQTYKNSESWFNCFKLLENRDQTAQIME